MKKQTCATLCPERSAVWEWIFSPRTRTVGLAEIHGPESYTKPAVPSTLSYTRCPLKLHHITVMSLLIIRQKISRNCGNVVTGSAYFMTLTIYSHSIQEEIKSRLKSVVLTVIRCRTFCLPVCCQKYESWDIQNYNSVCFVWVWNLVADI